MYHDYKIVLQRNPKPGPRADHLLWDAWVEGDEESGCEHGPTAADALRRIADRLEDEVEPEECPACNTLSCVCDYLRTDDGTKTIIRLALESGQRFLPHRGLGTHSAAFALEIISCESMLT
jgi:hypothetical protein